MIQYLKMDLIAAFVGVASLFAFPTAPLVPVPSVTRSAIDVPAQASVSATNGVPANVVTGGRKKWHPLRAMANLGIASWYGSVLNGHRTASGEIFDKDKMTACHRTLPFGTMVRVVDVNSGKSVVVKINDRGVLNAERVIDLSSAAARNLGILRSGVAKVRLEILGMADRTPKAPPTEEAQKQADPSVVTPL